MSFLEDTSMKAHRYTIDQLLDLKRSLPFVSCVIDNINKHPDIAAIFTLPEQAFHNPHTYTCLTTILSEQYKYTRPEVTTRRGESSSSSSQSMRSQGSWCLRQNTNSESRRAFDNQIQPHSAPTSVALHQAENFRRFYRAVVSPTHVRVTAGGRIVPNTRAMAPPSFEPIGNKHTSESLQQTNETEQIAHSRASNSIAGDAQASLIPVGAQGPPGFHPVFPGSFLPPYGYFHQGAPNMPGQTFSHPGHTQPLHQSVNSNDSTNSSLQPVRVSHPGQFDPNRPYMMVNNQLCFPTSGFPQPPSGFPSGLVGNPPFGPPMLGGPPGNHMPHPMLGPIPFPISPGNFPVPMMQHPNGQFFSMMPQQAHTQQTPMAPMLPLQSTSTDQTLQQHRDHLMMLEDHISRQSLQSVPYWANQRQVLMGEIARMTSLLQSERNQSGSGQTEQAKSQTSVDAGSSLDNLSNKNDIRSPVIVSSSPSTTLRSQEPSVAYANSSTTRSVDSPTIPRASTTKLGSGSRLPATAAMAPPFQPRGCRTDLSAAEWDEFARVTDPRPGGQTSPPATPENTVQRLARLMGNCQTRWEDSAAGSSMISMPRSQTMPVPQLQTHAASLPSFQRAETHPNSVSQMAQMSYVPGMNSHNTGLQPYARVNTQSYDPERFIAQKEYFGNLASNISNHGSTRQAPRFDTGRQTSAQTSPVHGNNNNQTTFTTEDYLNKCQSIFLNETTDSGVAKYASPWSSPERNSASHNALDTRPRVGRSIPPFSLTTKSLANEFTSSSHGDPSPEVVKTPRAISADAEGLKILSDVFAETPEEKISSGKKSAVLQGPQHDMHVALHSPCTEQATNSAGIGSSTRGDLDVTSELEDRFASTPTHYSTQTTSHSLDRHYTSEDLAIIFSSDEPRESTPKRVTRPASTPSLTQRDLGIIFNSNEPDAPDSYQAEKDSTTSAINSKKVEDLRSASPLNDLHAEASKQDTISTGTESLTLQDLGEIFASGSPQAVPSYKIEEASSVRLHTSEHLGGIFASNSPIRGRPGTVTPTYMNGDDVDDDKSIGSWARREDHRTSTSTQSCNEKENLIVTPSAQDGSPKSKSSFVELIRTTSSAVQKNQILKNLLNLQPATHSAIAAPAHVSSANAQGIVPLQNRGSAAASLAPAMVNMTCTNKSSAVTSPRSIASPSTPENRSRIGRGQSFHRSPEHLGNEDYLDCLKEIARHTSIKRRQAELQ
ncbi:hypothetical protein BELL_0417g00020 [Botrytis elliptica]|uniref:Uncharacterized protein n=1 Tax=Botrytis elliptica TaxID=278938 RepID=A0A4Z1JH34_9HELO|nr:hypothetical protein EAE99_006737 [Botrytis elliptica]TGO72796.1 hypothetical protein BELL_0417g00020 [Botrytis elliptica]